MPRSLALLFDLDGTLFDSDPLHLIAFQKLMKGYGRSMTSEYYNQHIMGGANNVIMRGLFPGMPESHYAELGDRKEALFRAELAKNVEPKAGLVKLLDWADSHEVPYCVVTNAPRINAETMLQALGLEKRLTELVIGEELARGKPDPLPYLEGLRRLGADAQNTLAFEDSVPGITAATSAGIFTYGMAGALNEATLKAAGASAVIEDFTDAALWDKITKNI